MPARRTRQEARDRILKAFNAQLDRVMPADEEVPLKGSVFVDFEEQAEALIRAAAPVFLEERAALEPNARVEVAGRCPHCGSDRVYLEKRARQAEVLSAHGLVMLAQQQARCRACDRSFSPSGTRLGSVGGGVSDATGGAAGGTGRGVAVVRSGGVGVE